MEHDESRKSRKEQSEKTENRERAVDVEGGHASAESADQADREPRLDEPFALGEETGEIARLMRGDPDAPREESPGDPFVPLSGVTDPLDPVVGLQAFDDLEAQSSDAIPTGDSPVSLPEAEIKELAQQIADELAALATSADSDVPSPDKLAGVVLRPVERADFESQGTTDSVDPDAQPQPPTPPRVDETARAVERFAGGIFQRPQPARERELTTLPRVVVSVQLADAREIMEEERLASATEMGAMLEKIADARIKKAEWRKGNQRRAADYRLRP
jgi:hypothetical protein